MSVRVQTEDFDVSQEMLALRKVNPKVGAVASFVGVVRDLNDWEDVSTLELEHYPGMTERSLELIVNEAKARWDIYDALIIHRVGKLQPLDQIVLVIVTSAHRGESF
ncbi:MAG: molybdenum cofactor biosynthesis protein MoaE, partial [Proteobacteria bacterium]|nr:molybdenum cofactor biosynthesis protein MoaE [Pseudomonadota bacterium]